MIKYKKISCPICKSPIYKKVGDWNKARYVICLNCSLVYTNPMLSDSYLSQLYKTSYSTTSSKSADLDCSCERKRDKERFKILLNHLGTKERKILDIGCSAGHFLKFFKKMNWDCYGIDQNKDHLKFAKKNFGIDTFCSMFEDFKTKEKFDIISLLSTIEHITNPKKNIKKIYELLSAGGYIFIVTPDVENIQTYWNFVFAQTHVILYSKISLRNLLLNQGFRIINIFSKNGSLYCIAKKEKKVKNQEFLSDPKIYNILKNERLKQFLTLKYFYFLVFIKGLNLFYFMFGKRKAKKIINFIKNLKGKVIN